MGFSIINIKFPELVLLLSSLNKLLGHIKAFYSFGIGGGRHDHEHQLQEENRPSASLVPVPVLFMDGTSVKNQLPVVEYSVLVNRRSTDSGGACDADDDDPTSCIICMNCINRSDEVRELSSCNHVFHRDCLDSWIDHGKIMCPLCKSKLYSSSQRIDSRLFGSDPWRKERMIYLFGQDEIMGTCWS